MSPVVKCKDMYQGPFSITVLLPPHMVDRLGTHANSAVLLTIALDRVSCRHLQFRSNLCFICLMESYASFYTQFLSCLKVYVHS